MYTRSHSVLMLAAIAALAAPLSAQMKNEAKHEASVKLKWGPAPPVFRSGAKMAVVSGDPTKTGQYVVQLSMPNGYRVAPHFHPTAESVEIKFGQLKIGMGDMVDAKAMKTLKKGDKENIAANMHHYVMARGKTVVEVSGTGPFVLTYVNATDDPQNKKKH